MKSKWKYQYTCGHLGKEGEGNTSWILIDCPKCQVTNEKKRISKEE